MLIDRRESRATLCALRIPWKATPQFIYLESIKAAAVEAVMMGDICTATLFRGGQELPCIDQSESIICLAS